MEGMFGAPSRWLLPFLVLLPACAVCGLGGRTIRIRVVDEEGAPVPDAQALLRRIGDPQSGREWISVEGGALLLPSPGRWPLSGTCEVLVRARGHALWRAPLEDVGRQELRVALSPGRRLELVLRTLDERPIPDSLTPIVFDRQLALDAWSGIEPGISRLSYHPVEKYGSRSFLVSAPMIPTELYVLIDEPGFLRAFQAGPITDAMIATGRLEVVLPAPAVVRCRYVAPTTEGEDERGFEVARHQELPGTGRHDFTVVRKEFEGSNPSLHCDDLAPGSYSFSVFAGSSAPLPDPSRSVSPEECKQLEVESAVEYRLVFPWSEGEGPADPR